MPKLLDQVRQLTRLRHYSYRTEKAYASWVKRYIVFHGLRHPRELGAPEVTALLSHLAAERRVSGSTQNQALAALLFLYRDVLGVTLPWLGSVERARRPAHAPAVFTRD
jgi:hypothetical protein